PSAAHSAVTPSRFAAVTVRSVEYAIAASLHRASMALWSAAASALESVACAHAACALERHVARSGGDGFRCTPAHSEVAQPLSAAARALKKAAPAFPIEAVQVTSALASVEATCPPVPPWLVRHESAERPTSARDNSSEARGISSWRRPSAAQRIRFAMQLVRP